MKSGRSQSVNKCRLNCGTAALKHAPRLEKETGTRIVSVSVGTFQGTHHAYWVFVLLNARPSEPKLGASTGGPGWKHDDATVLQDLASTSSYSSKRSANRLFMVLARWLRYTIVPLLC